MTDKIINFFISKNGLTFVMLALAFLGAAIGGLIAYPIAANTPVIQPTSINIVEKTTKMNSGGFAVGEVNGEQVLVRGDWVTGDVATVYPVTVDNGKKPQYVSENPNNPGWTTVLLGLVMGMGFGVILSIGFVPIATWLEKRQEQRAAVSRRLVDAAIA